MEYVRKERVKTMKFYNEDDMTDENFEKAWKEIDELQQKAIRNSRLLSETPKPKFNTIEEARAYYGSIPFSEWENKMREKYGL